jgi:hypothetical protein
MTNSTKDAPHDGTPRSDFSTHLPTQYRKRFDTITCDPALPASDTTIISRWADGQLVDCASYTAPMVTIVGVLAQLWRRDRQALVLVNAMGSGAALIAALQAQGIPARRWNARDMMATRSAPAAAQAIVAPPAVDRARPRADPFREAAFRAMRDRLDDIMRALYHPQPSLPGTLPAPDITPPPDNRFSLKHFALGLLLGAVSCFSLYALTH